MKTPKAKRFSYLFIRHPLTILFGYVFMFPFRHVPVSLFQLSARALSTASSLSLFTSALPSRCSGFWRLDRAVFGADHSALHRQRHRIVFVLRPA